MIRSSAKNHRAVTILTDPSQYDLVTTDMEVHNGCTTYKLRCVQRMSVSFVSIIDWIVIDESWRPLHSLKQQRMTHPLDRGLSSSLIDHLF